MSRVGPWLLWLLLPTQVAAQEEEPFQVHTMLRSAVEALAEQTPGALEESLRVSETCVPQEEGSKWRTGFEAAVESMLQKTKRSMQKGLSSLAQGVVELMQGCSCGRIAAFERFTEQAARLRVLATAHGGLASLDSKLRYEPLKALSVGGIDIHEPLNNVILSWQLQKGPEEMGRALMRFLHQFSDDLEDASEPPDVAVPPDTSAASSMMEAADFAARHGKRSSSYWVSAFNQAFERLGDPDRQVMDDCLSIGAAGEYSGHLDTAFSQMMEKTPRSMQMGLKRLAADTLGVLDSMEASCERLKSSSGAKRLRSACLRLGVLSRAKTLMQHGVHVEYEAMKVLKIGGIDVHLELNRFIGNWLHDYAPEELGEAMADFFEDFKEEEAPEESIAPESSSPLFRMLRDAIVVAQAGRNEPLDLAAHCFDEAAATVYAKEMDAAIDHMLKKRRKTMQQGLKELADATDRLLSGQQVECVWSSGAKILWLAAKKLGRLTRKTVVDYGTHIQYEAMKSLTVGNIAIHAELNNFLVAWKIKNQAEAGTPFGELMLKLSKLDSNDEL